MMNKRIDELIEECTSVNDDLVYDGRDSYMKTTEYFDKEKFAELIVKECMKELKDMIVDESELLYPNNKQTTEFVNDRLLDAYDNIKEHFGVEE